VPIRLRFIAAQTRFHSPRTLPIPRSRNLRKPSTLLIHPKGGTLHFAARCKGIAPSTPASHTPPQRCNVARVAATTCRECGAPDRVRTDDIQLGKLSAPSRMFSARRYLRHSQHATVPTVGMSRRARLGSLARACSWSTLCGGVPVATRTRGLSCAGGYAAALPTLRHVRPYGTPRAQARTLPRESQLTR
jgi:hypothetical protein